jgi:hypothetical protein
MGDYIDSLIEDLKEPQAPTVRISISLVGLQMTRRAEKRAPIGAILTKRKRAFRLKN